MKSVKILSLLIVLCILLSSFSVFAQGYTFPSAFWPPHNEYIKAKDEKDHQNIIKYGKLSCEVLQNEPLCSEVLQVFASRYFEVARSYEALEDYENAAKYYEKAIFSNKECGWDDAVKICIEKSEQFKTDIRLYTRSYNDVLTHNAKGEQSAGVYLGMACDSENREKVPNESMTLLYHIYGEEFNGYNESFLKKASEKGIAVEFALNLANEGSDIKKINQSAEYAEQLAEIISKYKNIPIYLRFAGEVNVWQNKADPEEYKKAFRTVAQIFREKCENVVMVYGINFVSEWYSTPETYYPGDEYVDWIGVSLYCMKYHQGKVPVTDSEKLSQVMFYAGNSAEPVLMMKDIVDTFGDRKPIMIYECGASAKAVNLNEDTQEFAVRRLEKIMNYLPMVYPQIKMIAYFDQYREGSKNDYSLKHNDTLLSVFVKNSLKSHFVQNTYTNDNVSTFVNCDKGFNADASVNEFYVYAQIYSSQYERVNYFIDDKWVGSSDKIPYKISVDLSKYSVGKHKLSYIVDSDTGRSYKKSVSFYITENLKVALDGKDIECPEQSPLLVNGRTLIPVRALYEALGAAVSWDAETKTVTATLGTDTVRMTIGSKTIYKNGQPVENDVSPKIIHNKTLVPARIAAELFGKTVKWNGEERRAYIY